MINYLKSFQNIVPAEAGLLMERSFIGCNLELRG
jgi:hypothetical protein